MKPLIWKELRENVRWMPVGVIVVSVICWMARPNRSNPGGLIASDLVTQLAIVTPLLAFALGVVQAYRDLQPGAGAYLHHRGVTGNQIFMAKTIAGFAIYATSIVIPILGLACWIAYHGMSWYPMRPAQVVPSLAYALASFTMHPAAMLMMSRGASWWGTRWFPLIPAGAALLPFFASLQSGGLWGAGVSLIFILPLLAWMIAISRQSWRELSSEPPASRANVKLSRRWLLPTYLLIGVTLCWMTLVAFFIETVENASRPRVWVPTPEVSFALHSATHEPGLLTYLQEYDANAHGYSVRALGGDVVTQGATVDPMRPLEAPKQWRSFSYMQPISSTWYQSDGFFTNVNQLQGLPLTLAYDLRGYMICYEQYPERRWTATIARDAVYPPGDFSGEPFLSEPTAGSNVFSSFSSAGYTTPLLDGHGVYIVGTEPLSISTLIDQPIDSATLVPLEKGHAPRLLVRHGDQISEYQFMDANGSDTWYVDPNEDLSPDAVQYQSYSKLKSLKDFSLSAKVVHTYQVPAPIAESTVRVGLANDALYLAVYDQRSTLYRVDAADGFEKIDFQPTTPAANASQDGFDVTHLLAGWLPGFVGVLLAGFATWGSLFDVENGPTWGELVAMPIQLSTTIISFAVVTAFIIWFTRRVAYRRGLSHNQTMCWCASALLLGMAAPLSMVAIYRQVHREKCSHCGKPRRVDTETCEHCDQPWDRPLHDGIVMLDRAA